jgi:serine/threonine protein phosphatase PrpC
MIFEKYAAETSKGPFLENNEDDYSVDVNKKLFMVLDGFGGLNVGDKAAQSVRDDINKFYDDFVADKNMTMSFFYSAQYLIEANALINACMHAHKNLYEKNQKLEISARGGVSGIIGVIADSVLFLLSVGNCSSYLLRSSGLEQLTKIESFKHFSSAFSPSREVEIPMNAFGLFERFSFQSHELRILKNDRILLGSDGAFCGLDSHQLRSIFLEREVESLSEKIKKSFELSNNFGNTDNQTMLALEF